MATGTAKRIRSFAYHFGRYGEILEVLDYYALIRKDLKPSKKRQCSLGEYIGTLEGIIDAAYDWDAPVRSIWGLQENLVKSWGRLRAELVEQNMLLASDPDGSDPVINAIQPPRLRWFSSIKEQCSRIRNICFELKASAETLTKQKPRRIDFKR